ncbi:hypothetical protein HPB52_000211 [Rhipicephalus sanguineus]|uniref:Uncharacterized protein n=1 Tax=Rhipicephalus sanguineus TaxID=34632 RepID=A0A9D4QFZ9_RHISA|nr:hypothetical protein HPB52_000211 [Rhipicephalus sanguineus]
MQCHRFGHLSDACVSTYASKLRSGQSSAEEPHLDHLMDATEVGDATGEATGEAVGGLKEDQHLSMEAMPSSHNNTAKDVSEDISDEITAGEHSLEELKEKPPDDEGEEEAMDSSQTRKRPAPLSDEARTSASDATQQMSSCGPRVVSFGDRGSRRLCQRPQESAAKKCKGGKTTGCPVAKGDKQKL